MRTWQGPAIFSFGFRPFFFFGAIWLVIAMSVWMLALSGSFYLPSHFDIVSWHAHEFLFGYLGAVLAGFLLTAVPNWTGRLPIVGWPLAAFFALWCAGRITIFTSAISPVWLGTGLDIAFPILLGSLVLHEIIAGKNWHNLIVLALLAFYTLGNILFHFEALTEGYALKGTGIRLGLATSIMMITFIGGRIIPSFTRNWLVRRKHPARPTPPMQVFDKFILLASLTILLLWVFFPVQIITAVLLLVFGILHTVRLIRWRGYHTLRQPLIWILHVSYAFIPLGAIVLAADTLTGSTGHAPALHIWMAGAIGSMTIAIMTRATLGHTGRDLVANRATVVMYIFLLASVVFRVTLSGYPQFIMLSGLLWITAFGGFVIIYGPSLLCPKPASSK